MTVETRADQSDVVAEKDRWCENCGGEGKIYTSRYGGNDPDVWPIGECEACKGSGWERVLIRDNGEEVIACSVCQP